MKKIKLKILVAVALCVVLSGAGYVWQAKFAEDGRSLPVPNFVFSDTNDTVCYSILIHKDQPNPWGTAYRDLSNGQAMRSERVDDTNGFTFAGEIK